VTGRLAYEYFYRLTILLIKSFSTVPLKFFGKFPFWFFGDPIFGLIIGCIPLTVFITSKIYRGKTKTLLRTTIIYSLTFISTYLLACWVTSIGLLASNDFYKAGQELSYNLRQIELNEIFLLNVIISTIATAIFILTENLILGLQGNMNKAKTIKNNV